MLNQITTDTAPAPTLPHIGYSRLKTLLPFIAISREKFRQLVRQGKAPQALHLGSRCAMYPNEEVHRWLNDPLAYQVEVKQ